LIFRNDMDIRQRLLTTANAHVLMVAFLFGGMGSLVLGLQQVLKAAEASVRPELKVAVFIQPNVNDADAAAWARALPAADPEIASVDFVSRAEALQKAQGNPALVKSLLLLRENPFPASAVIQYQDRAWLERPEPALALKSMPQVQEIRWDSQVRSVFRSLRQWRMWLARLTAFAAVMLAIWCFFGIYRFLVLQAPTAELLVQLGIGLIGGGLAVMTWALALRGIESDAALYKPEAVSFWPLLTAFLAALATFGWRIYD
jgi:cell division protein FtsX